MGLTTAYVALYNARPHGIELVSPIEPSGQGYYKNQPFVVLGGASSVGQYGSSPHLTSPSLLPPTNRLYTVIQLAKFSGFSPIIVTASLKHTDYLKSLGATHVLDRNLSLADLKSEIEKITSQPIKHVYDTVSSSETQHAANEILAPGGHLMLVLSPVITSADKHVTAVLAIRQLEHNVKLLTGFYTKLTEWVENGIIKAFILFF